MPGLIPISIEQRLVGLGVPHRVTNTLRDKELTDEQVEAWGDLREPLRRGEIAVLHGPFGVGKTTLAAYFMRSCIAAKPPRSCLMYTVAGLMASQKNWFNSYQTKSPSPFERATKAYFLVLDELAVEGSEFDKTNTSDIIKARYNANLPTLIITNVTPQHHHLALTGAVMDRLKDGAVVGMRGESMRGIANG